MFQNPYLNKLYPRELELIEKIKPIKKQVSKTGTKGVETKKVSISKKSAFQYQPTFFLLLIVGIFSFSIYFNLNKNNIKIDEIIKINGKEVSKAQQVADATEKGLISITMRRGNQIMQFSQDG